MYISNINKWIGGATIDIIELYTQFSRHCDDFNKNLFLDLPSKAVEFCSKIIYEVGSGTKQVVKDTGDKTWRFVFMVGEVKHVVVCKTYKFDKLRDSDVIRGDRTISLTVKEAGMIAMNTLIKLIPLGVARDIYLLTPLAGAIFSKTDINEIAHEYARSVENTLIAINSSCQGGGQYMGESDGTIAALAIYTSTRNVTKEGVRMTMCNKLVRQYINRGKEINRDMFFKLAKYSTGGIPTELAFETLVKVYDEGRNRRLNRREVETALDEVELLQRDAFKKAKDTLKKSAPYTMPRGIRPTTSTHRDDDA